MLESPKSHRIPTPALPAETVGSDQALAVYAEAALSVRGRRGLVIGPADGGMAERLLAMGARSIHVFDPVASRAEAVARVATARGLVVRALDERALDFRDEAFEFGLVTELANVPNVSYVLTQVRRILDRSGALLVRTKRGPGGVEYADLFDLISLEFPYVAMIGELPFGGVAFAELGGESPEVAVDTQLADEPDPRAFLALGSYEPRLVEGYAIVQLPSALASGPSPDLAEAEARELEDAEAFARLTGEIYALREQLDREGEKGMRLAMDLEKAEHALAAAKRAAESRVAEAMQASQEASVALQQRLAADLDEKMQAAQQDLASRLAEAEAQLLTQDAQVVRLSQDLIDAKKRLEVPTVDAKVADELTARVAQAERRFSAVEAELGQLSAEHVAEVSSLEAQLLDRARMLKAQDAELVRRAAMIEDLLSALEEAHAGAALHLPERPSHDDARLVEMRRRLDDLALEVARREGELEARAWRIKELENERDLSSAEAKNARAREAERRAELERVTSELERARSEAEAAKAARPEPERRSQPALPDASKLEEELFALRQALVQEHDARREVMEALRRKEERILELENDRRP